MAHRDSKTILQGVLTGILVEEDPIKAMPEWLLTEQIRIEGEAKLGVPKGKHRK